MCLKVKVRMEVTELARRKALQASVAALCVEVGFVSSEKDAMGTLSEVLQSYITELGRTSRLYSELAQRTEPTVSDVELALVDVGARDVQSLLEHSKRPQRRHLHRQSKSYQPPQPKCLQVGAKATRPSNIPPHLPAFPDPHTYVRTPTFAVPSSDYKIVREKLATQKRNSRKGLSSLLAKTRPSRPIAGEDDPFGVYTVVKNESPAMPAYLQALMPTPEDQADNTSTAGEPGDTEGAAQEAQRTVGQPSSEDMDISLADTDRTTDSMETFENPFVKAPTRAKLQKQ